MTQDYHPRQNHSYITEGDYLPNTKYTTMEFKIHESKKKLTKNSSTVSTQKVLYFCCWDLH